MDGQFHRRRLMQAALATLAAGAATPALASTTPALVSLARRGLERAGGAVAYRDVVGIADFTAPSKAPRFHLVDLRNGTATSLLVAHGRGSDPAHSGWLRSFSNDVGSAATSQGAYVTGDYYVGKHGRSMRLHGLEGSNSNAEPRAIVVHGAWYVSPKMVAEHGMLGRSEGCFAFDEGDLPQVLARLGPGRLLLAGKF
ncbi:murein L,D-transpeptidase catalytic domain family protein [Phenylobacterium sp.]|uniref:murein L,D-transpeptidase catalytic domain family protein n=1 Tax=Phenylobacterium sp. TaxID=1871053 RepID=UPI0025D7F174|nr:murein L,D-transpeptidase catalytic domain family protein [Phenylobacterium sp.]